MIRFYLKLTIMKKYNLLILTIISCVSIGYSNNNNLKSTIGFEYRNGIYFPGSTTLENTKYIDYKLKPASFYGFGLNYYLKCTNSLYFNVGIAFNQVYNQDRYVFRVNDFYKNYLKVNETPFDGDLNDKLWFRSHTFSDNELKINLVQRIPIKNNFYFEYYGGVYVNYTFKKGSGYSSSVGWGNSTIDSSITYIDQHIETNPNNNIILGINTGVSFLYAFKKAGEIKLKIGASSPLTKSAGYATTTIFTGFDIEEKHAYTLNHAHLDFCLEYVLPFRNKMK